MNLAAGQLNELSNLGFVMFSRVLVQYSDYLFYTTVDNDLPD